METSFIIGAAVGGSYLLGRYAIKSGRSKKCPKCGKWFAIKEVKSEIVGKTDTFKSESYHEETGDYEVKTVGKRTVLKAIKKLRFRTVPAVSFRYKHWYDCRFCHQQSTAFSNVVY